MENKLISGNIWKSMLFFSLPFLLSYFLQTLYGMADLFITGQYNTTDVITAVSIGSQVMHMITVMIVGLAMGATVKIGQTIGAGEYDEASVTIGNTVTLFMAISLAVTAVLLICVKPIVMIMSTPEEAVASTISYLVICFIGIPFITAYNVISSIYRGLGDSKKPMYFVIIACIMNIILDYIFIGGLNLGSMGAALGTTISQSISVVVAIFFIRKEKNVFTLSKESFRPDKRIMEPILKIGIPVSLQDGFIQISFIVITIIANRRGLVDAAAVGIVEKVICFLFLVPSTMLSTVSALAAQNIGAGRDDRALKTLKIAIITCICYGVIIAVIVQFAAEPIVMMFDDTAEVVRAGGQYIRGYIWDCIFAGIHFSFSGYLCAYGRSNLSFIHNTLSIIFFRIPGAYLMSKLFASTLLPMGCAAACGSLFSVVFCVIALVLLIRKKAISI